MDQCGLRIQITGSHNSALNAAYSCSLDSSCPIAFTWLAKVKNTEGNISKTSENKNELDQPGPARLGDHATAAHQQCNS